MEGAGPSWVRTATVLHVFKLYLSHMDSRSVYPSCRIMFMDLPEWDTSPLAAPEPQHYAPIVTSLACSKREEKYMRADGVASKAISSPRCRKEGWYNISNIRSRHEHVGSGRLSPRQLETTFSLPHSITNIAGIPRSYRLRIVTQWRLDPDLAYYFTLAIVFQTKTL
jgi:hypothetical protein